VPENGAYTGIGLVSGPQSHANVQQCEYSDISPGMPRCVQFAYARGNRQYSLPLYDALSPAITCQYLPQLLPACFLPASVRKDLDAVIIKIFQRFRLITSDLIRDNLLRILSGINTPLPVF
jgi:hypothetical protein